MIGIADVVPLAAILLGSTLFFPPEGKKALIFRIVAGVFYGIGATLFVIVVIVKFPELGWRSLSIPLLSVLSIVFYVQTYITLSRALPDLINWEIKEYYISSWILVRGSVIEEPTTVYYIKGRHQNGKRFRFYINKKTFIKLLCTGGKYQLLVRTFARTKIVLKIKIIRQD